MYITKVVPLKRRIPGGELSYISKSKIEVGSILYVPIKSKDEVAVVVESNSVVKSKEFLKSLKYSLVTIKNTEIKYRLDKKLIKAIYNFSVYSIQDFNDVVFKLFNKTNFDKSPDIKNLGNINISTNSSNLKNNIYSFHTFLSIFTKPKLQLKSITIINPELFSIYGINILGFDILPLFLFIKEKFELNIIFNSKTERLRWNSWKIKNIYEKENLGKLGIVDRSAEKHGNKSNPIAEETLEYIKKQDNSKKILILSSSRNIATRSMCSDCHAFHKCPKCDHFLTLVKNNRSYAKKYGIAGEYIYICNNCSFAETSIIKCRTCDSWNLTALGYGAEKIEEFLKQNLKGFKIYNSHTSKSIKSEKSFAESGGIMISGFNSIYEKENIDIVLIPSLSVYLYNSSFESGETVHNIIKTARSVSERVIVQAMRKEEIDFINKDSDKWKETELKDRQDLMYPPYARYIAVRLDTISSNNTRFIESISQILKKNSINNSVETSRDTLGAVSIYASFKLTKWNTKEDSLDEAESLTRLLIPFLKHVKIEVY